MRWTHCLFMLFMLSAAVAQQEPSPDPLAGRPKLQQAITLRQAVEIALRESPVLRGAVEEVRAAAARVEMARAMRRPMVSTTGSLSGGTLDMVLATSDPVRPSALIPVPSGRFADLNLMAMLPLTSGGRLEALVRQAEAARWATAAQEEATKLEVALETRLMYRQALVAGEFIKVAQSYLEAIEERLRIDREAARVGRIPEFWVLRSEAERANALQTLVNTQRDQQIALLALKVVMGVHPDSELAPSDTLEIEPIVVERPALRTEALEQRPELQAASQQLRVGQEGERAARALYRPQINLMGMSDLMSAGERTRSGGYLVGMVVSLPLIDGGQRRSMVREAQAMQQRARWDWEQERLKVVQQVDAGIQELQAARQNVQTAETALQAAEEDLRVARVRYEAGRSVLVEYLDALTAAVRARAGYAQALYEQATANDRLLRAVGRLP